MAIIFVTGLSGVGKSSVLKQLGEHGYNVVDTDYNCYTKSVKQGESNETIWDEEKISKLIEEHKQSQLFLSGCYSNQGKFYQSFKSVVLLRAELNVMLERIDKRASHSYGKSRKERAEVIESYETVLPLLEKSSHIIIDTTYIEVNEVCRQLEKLV